MKVILLFVSMLLFMGCVNRLTFDDLPVYNNHRLHYGNNDRSLELTRDQYLTFVEKIIGACEVKYDKDVLCRRVPTVAYVASGTADFEDGWHHSNTIGIVYGFTYIRYKGKEYSILDDSVAYFASKFPWNQVRR